MPAIIHYYLRDAALRADYLPTTNAVCRRTIRFWAAPTGSTRSARFFIVTEHAGRPRARETRCTPYRRGRAPRGAGSLGIKRNAPAAEPGRRGGACCGSSHSDDLGGECEGSGGLLDTGAALE
jgi:hypothetical protein